MWNRLWSVVLKELLVVLRDPRSRVILVVPPLMQLILFSFAATLEVKNVDIVLLNRDEGRSGQELADKIAGAPTFRSIHYVHDEVSFQSAIDQQRALLGVSIGPNFSRDLNAGRLASIEVSLDGRRSNAAQVVDGYISTIIDAYVTEENRRHRKGAAPIVVAARNWFNPNLEFTWFTVPGLIAIVAQLVGLIVTALSVARERELGTFDQLLVAPLHASEILIGKTIPPILIGMFHITLYVLATVYIFEVPLRGSLPLLYLGALFFLASVVGIGLFISSMSSTQQQAILGAFLFLAPATLLSGFATPIENMPEWLQPVTWLNPLRHFLVVVRGVFLKDIPAIEVARNTMPLALIATASLSASAWLFRKKLE